MDKFVATLENHGVLASSKPLKTRSSPCWQQVLVPILMENRNGLVVEVAVTHANGTAEREAALQMLKRPVKKGATEGAD